jgi:phage terminase small subunit
MAIDVPEHLSKDSAAWFKRTAAEFLLGDADLLVLQAAAESWDRCQEARQILERDGLTFVDNRKAIRPHPCVAIEAQHRTLFARLVRDLNLPTPTDLVEMKLNG